MLRNTAGSVFGAVRRRVSFGYRSFSAHTEFHGNVNAFPEFHPKDNSTGLYDESKHNKEVWEHSDIANAIEESSIFSWGASDPLRETCVPASRSEGIYIYDENGKRYFDWSAGAVCTNLGHTVPDTIKKAIADQLDSTAFVYGDISTHDPRARLCSLLKDLSPGDIDSFFFASGGSEANEAAMRMARRYTGRPKIMSRYRSYHGGSTSSLAMTGDPRTWAVDATSSGFVKMLDPFPFHFQWDEDPVKSVEKCLNALHDQILWEGPEAIAAIFLEPVTGANGWLLPHQSFMQGVRALCDKYGILLVSDEVMTGFGRTGKMFGFQHYDGVLPDMYTFAKGVTSSYLPLSGVATRKHIYDHFRKAPLGYGSTYFAHPVCMAAGYATLKYMIEHDIVGHVNSVEPIMKKEMAKLVEKHPSVKQGRVVGLGAGFDLAGKDGNFMMNMHETSEGQSLLKRRMREEGILTIMRGHHVHCTPPLTITGDEIEEGFAVLSRCLESVDEWVAATN